MVLGREAHVHSACFDELDAAVSALLKEQDDDRVVCFNAQCFPAPPDAVIFNLENVPGQVPAAAWPDREVWDFSFLNASRLRLGSDRSKPVRYVPVGYHPSMTRFVPLPMAERDVDVAFAGSMNERRSALIEQIRAKGFRVEVVPHTSYGAARDVIFSKAKLIINPRFYDDGLYPQLRSLHAVANGVFTVSEEAPETPLWCPCSVPYDRMAARVEHYLSLPPARLEHLSHTARAKLKEHPMRLPSV